MGSRHARRLDSISEYINIYVYIFLVAVLVPFLVLVSVLSWSPSWSSSLFWSLSCPGLRFGLLPWPGLRPCLCPCLCPFWSLSWFPSLSWSTSLSWSPSWAHYGANEASKDRLLVLSWLIYLCVRVCYVRMVSGRGHGDGRA